jgi:hypothetical protein
MAAPTNAAKREESSCQLGAVHTWHSGSARALVVLVAAFGSVKRLGRRRRRDEQRVHGRELLPVELGVVVLVQQKQLDDAGGEARHPAQLPGIDRIDDVHDLGRRDTHDLARKPRIGHVARVSAQEVVGHAAPDCIGLDALPNNVPAG